MKINRKEEDLLKALRRMNRLREYETEFWSKAEPIKDKNALSKWIRERDKLEVKVKKYIDELSGELTNEI